MKDLLRRLSEDELRERMASAHSVCLRFPNVEGNDFVLTMVERIERLEGTIERERSQAARWLERIRAEMARWLHVSEGRGCYEWDDDRYRGEFKKAMDAIISACDKAAKDCKIASFEDCPKTQEAVAQARVGML